MKQHKADVESKKSDSEISGISKHARYCTHGKINWDTPEILEIKKKITSFHYKKSLGKGEPWNKNNSVFNGYNDPQLIVNNNAWNSILKDLKKFERGNGQKGT